MSCGCKGNNKNIDSYLADGTKSQEKLGPKIVTYILKSIAFVLMIAALPIINLFIIWFIFRTLMLNKEVDIKPLLSVIGKKFQDKQEDDEEEYDNLTEDDVVLVNVEEITSTSK
jgi:hypothetical protein